MGRNRRRKQRAKRIQLDMETRSVHPLNTYPDEIAALYYREDGGPLKRVSYNRSQYDELYAINPQLATYSVMDFGTEIHQLLEQHVIMGGDMLTGEPHTNPTATQVKAECRAMGERMAEYRALEARIMAWWLEQYEAECRAAFYGGAVYPVENNSTKRLDTGRDPAKSDK